MTQPAAYDDLPRQTSVVERVATALLMVGLGLVALVASFLGLFFAMASDGCTGDTPCNGSQLGLGVLVAAGSPAVVFLGALVVVIRRVAGRRPAWWVPLVALGVGAVLWALGGLIAVTSVG